MRMNRILSLTLAAALTAALALPVSAEKSSFSDISDNTTAVNGDILRLMGVVSGVGDNRFNPADRLTRAQFCAMMVNFMQLGDQLPLYASRTIFTDVTAKHWALPYVNLAASRTYADGERNIALIAGVGNGSFAPDKDITLAEAATVLLHVLEYGTAQTGTAWPESYLNLARAIGLTDGVQAGKNQPITRAQAAQLFVNALTAKTGSGAVYYEKLGQTRKEDAIILAVGVTADDGSTGGAIRTSVDTNLTVTENVKPTALLGKRGTLVLDGKDRIVTFVPDDSSPVVATLKADATPAYMLGTDGKKYAANEKTLVYTADGGEGASYNDAYPKLKTGATVTMYMDSGKLAAVYATGGAALDSTDSVVVQGTPNAAMFHRLTGGASDFKIVKHGKTIPMSGLNQYDVVTYDKLNNALVVSDLRLTCVYEDAYPNAQAPTEIRILGAKLENKEEGLPVLDSAWDSIQNFKLGDQAVLLLTADGKVAGMTKPDHKLQNTAMGLTGGGKVELLLPNGEPLTLTGTLTGSGKDGINVVSVSSSRRGEISVRKLYDNAAPGDLNVKNRTLGQYPLAPDVRIYEKAGNSAVTPLTLQSLDLETVPAGKVAAHHLNSSGQADILILDKVSGDGYSYGILNEDLDENGKPQGDRISLDSKNTTLKNNLEIHKSFRDGSFVGLVDGIGLSGDKNVVLDLVELTEVKNVKSSDFFETMGKTYVTAGGRTYRVADDVQCRKSVAKEWFKAEKEGQNVLDLCLAFSNDLTLYIDPIGSKVRIITAN